jgi:hypothetical protein
MLARTTVGRRSGKDPATDGLLAAPAINCHARMVVFRCTRKLLDRPVEPAAVRSTGLLGDWYATILTPRPSWLSLLVSERTRLPVILPARPLATVAERFGLALASVLRDLQIDASAIMREVATMDAVCFTTTQSRSILGTIQRLLVSDAVDPARPSDPDAPPAESEVSGDAYSAAAGRSGRRDTAVTLGAHGWVRGTVEWPVESLPR